VAATGPWTRPLFQKAGLDLPIETEYHQVAILKNAPDMKGGGCACIDSVTATYFRSDAHDKFLIGDFYGQRGADPDNFPQRAADHELEEIIERASRRVPKLENAEVMRGVTGIYDMTPDSRPLLGEIPDVRGLYVSAGFLRNGFQDFPSHWPGNVGTIVGWTGHHRRHQLVLAHPLRGGQAHQGRVRVQRRLVCFWICHPFCIGIVIHFYGLSS